MMGFHKSLKKKTGYKCGLFSRIEHPTLRWPLQQTFYYNSDNPVAVIYATQDDIDSDISRVWLIDKMEFVEFEGVEGFRDDYTRAHDYVTRSIEFHEQDKRHARKRLVPQNSVKKPEIDFSQFDGYVPEQSHEFDISTLKIDPMDALFEALSE